MMMFCIIVGAVLLLSASCDGQVFPVGNLTDTCKPKASNFVQNDSLNKYGTPGKSVWQYVSTTLKEILGRTL